MQALPAIREDGRMRALVEAIAEETAHLDGYISNLLSATRVAVGGLSPRLEWADPKDTVHGAIKRRSRRIAAHLIETAFADDLPLLHVDSGLVEEACGQILENAAKYSPSGSTISVEVRSEHQRVIVRVSDQGVGITPDEQKKLGRRSFRSAVVGATLMQDHIVYFGRFGFIIVASTPRLPPGTGFLPPETGAPTPA